MFEILSPSIHYLPHTVPSGDTHRAVLPPAQPTLLERFNTYFEVVAARTKPEIEQCQRIRYQVYCTEHAYEDPEQHLDGLENDAFDSHAVHSLLIHRSSAQAMGTVRLILPIPGAFEHSFAIQDVCDHPFLNTLPSHGTAEISRFSISKQFRRRQSDTQYEGDPSLDVRRREQAGIGPLMSLGLIQSLVSMSLENSITHWCATMEPKLLRLLAAMGIRFSPLGPLVQYHGLRQPCYCEVATMLERVKEEQRPFWDVLTGGGGLLNYTPIAV